MDESWNISEKFIRISVLRGLMVHKALRGKELFKGQFPIMETICENEGCSQKFLSDRLLVSPASIALSIKRLVKAGMIHKETDENNLRCNRIYSTEKGRRTRDEAYEIHMEIHRKTFDGFSPEEKACLESYFDRIIENLGGRSASLPALQEQLHAEENYQKEE